MTETALNSKDRIQLKEDIRISMLFGLLFSLALIIFLWLILAVIVIFIKHPSAGFFKRGLYITGLLFTPFLGISCANFLKYLDLKKGKKIVIQTNNYAILNQKDNAYILTIGKKRKKIRIDKELIPFIIISQPLTIEISKLAKLLLFVSHDSDNLLDRLYEEENN